MIVITVGKSYIDIDGYASAIAYKELFNMQGIEAKFVSSATLNYSVTKSLINMSYSTDNYVVTTNDKFIILDLSDKNYFPDFIKENNIIEIIDHHPGFKKYWMDKLQDKCEIEDIGSVATIIVEKYEKCNLLNNMSKDIAKLLMAAILDNTLNFTANITTTRDKIAYKKLEDIVDEHNYAESYFKEVQEVVESNLDEAIKNDIKVQHISNLLPDVFGQLTIWDANSVLKNINKLKSIMNTYGSKWIMNLISLKDNSSYIVYSDNSIKTLLKQFLDFDDSDEALIIKPSMLRKEIMKKAMNNN